MGVGTNTPDTTATFKGGVSGAVGTRIATLEGNLPELLFKDTSNNTGFAIAKYGGIVYFVNTNSSGAYSSYSGLTNSQGQWSFGGGFNPSGTVHIKGSGSTSATTSLLVQNSLGNTSLKVNDNQLVEGFSGSIVRFKLGFNGSTGQAISTRDGQFALGLIDTDQLAAIRFLTLGTGASYIDAYSEGTSKAANYPLFIGSRTNNASTLVAGSTTEENGTRVVFGSAVSDASALVQINSTTRGFLPPRGTNTQMNAIASPATGLVFYDTTNNKLCVYNATSWIPLH